MFSRPSVSVPVFALVLAAAGRARAEGGNPAAAEALFDQGRAALAEGDLASACSRFRESDRLDPALGTRFNLADCEEKRGHLATAWGLFRSVVAQLADTDDRRPIAQGRLATLEQSVPRLTLVLAPGAPRFTRVKEGDTEYAEGSFGVALPLDPGLHHLVVIATGHQPRRVDIALEAGETAELSIAPGAALPSDGHLSSLALRAEDHRTLGYVLAGVGATGLFVGVVSGLLVLHQKGIYDSNCDAHEKVCNQTGKDAGAAGRALSMVSVAGFAAGVAASAVGTYFILTSDARGAPQASLSGAFGPGAAFFSLRRTF